MNIKYYSDKLNGEQARDIDEISADVWGGIVAEINSRISSDAFAKKFPLHCADAGAVYATDNNAFSLALKAEIPSIEFPLVIEKKSESSAPLARRVPFVPHYLKVLDLIQFCYKHCAKPIQSDHHPALEDTLQESMFALGALNQKRSRDRFSHYHLTFDIEEGKAEFRSTVNLIFARNSISYKLQEDGDIVRLAPEILAETLQSARFQTQDSELNNMLEDARKKFLSPDEKVRRESLERLWDAWERIKSLLKPDNKRESVALLLDQCADETEFRKLLEEEASSLTKVGNTFQIRHSEVNQVNIQCSEQVDYIFHRMFSLILLAVRSIAK